MQLVIISVALLASIAACSVNVFSQETQDSNQDKQESVWTSQITYVDPNPTQQTPENLK